MDHDRIGGWLGIGLAGAGTVGALAAIIRAVSRQSSDQDRLQACEAYYSGTIPGYATQPGDLYQVWANQDGQMVGICPIRGIWFESRDEERKFVYDVAKAAGLPAGGALLAVAHHMKAGSHAVGAKAPLRGMNLWGMKGSGSWWTEGHPVWMAGTVEYDEHTDKRTSTEARWRFYDTPEESVAGWLESMRKWPKARACLYRKQPNPYEYAWYLQGEHAIHGHDYATGLADVSAGGAWSFGRAMAVQMQAAAKGLAESFGYDGLGWALDIPTLSDEDVLALAHDPGYGNPNQDYPFVGYPVE